MALTDAQRRANRKYQAKTIASLACRVKKDQAEAFKVYCEIRGRTSNAVLRDYVLGCIGQGNAPGYPQEAAGARGGPGSIPISLDTLKAAERAAGATGESVPDFVARAVDTQEKRDRASLAVGISPTTMKGGEAGE